MLVFEIKDDEEHILGKKSKKMILGLDELHCISEFAIKNGRKIILAT